MCREYGLAFFDTAIVQGQLYDISTFRYTYLATFLCPTECMGWEYQPKQGTETANFLKTFPFIQYVIAFLGVSDRQSK